MQQLLTGKKRLRGFKGKWGDVELGDLLIYEQPTNYLVKDTLYNDAYETPVLTAGKTFILGYTNEQNGICTDLPVIIFDDFTTSSKYVNFPFKAKSSAMKILRPKHNVNLKFVYEAMQLMNYVVGGHERHWISKFVYLTIPCPLPEEQIAIANIFQTVDKEIQILQNKLDKLKEQKKGLMQILLTGKKRLTVRTGLAPVPKKIK
ncbi:MAG: restriction endonuclease subunit S [Bacteroidota bacterium]